MTINIGLLNLSNKSFLKLFTRRYCQNVINIPTRIHRGPTDILRALSNTVGTDYTAAHYKYHDDPFLIPTSNVGKRTFAMAQEAGRKSAQWIKQENPQLFQHAVADPPVADFLPKVVFNENSEVCIENLESAIMNVEISDAILIYNLLKSKGIDVSHALKLQLLQLVCYFNCEDTLSDEWIEERWFRQSTTGKERQRKTWKDGDFAEKLFSEIEPKDRIAYGSLIRGMAKFYQVEKAWALFQEALTKGIKLNVGTFNSILQVSCFIKESSELRWEHTTEILNLMASNNVMPNLETLNAVLFTISSTGTYKFAKQNALKTLSEFKNLNIVPSLASWYYLLIIFCRERGPVSHVLVDILNEIENKEFKIEDIKDTFFFVTAMDVCRYHLHDKDLAYRVNQLLHIGNNYNLIGDSYKESIYYRHYLTLLVQTEPIEKFMNETYNYLVPNVYIPEPTVIDEILKSIDTNGALTYLPKIWSDMTIFDHIHRDNLVNRILRIMVDNTPNLSIPEYEGLDEKFMNIAWSVWTYIEGQSEKRVNKLAWTGEMIGNVLQICARNGDLEKSFAIFEKLDKNQHTILGSPSANSLKTYVELCIKEKEPSKAITCLQYYSENMLNEAEELGRLIIDQMTLNDTQISKINSLAGIKI